MESRALWEIPICAYWALELHAAFRPPWNFTWDPAIQTLILTPVLQALYLLSHIPQSNVLKNRKGVLKLIVMKKDGYTWSSQSRK